MMVAAVPMASEPLLGATAQRLDLGLLGARTAAVMRRVVARREVDAVDRAMLDSSVDVLGAAADAVGSIEDGRAPARDRRSAGFGAMAFTIELTAPAGSSDDLSAFLHSIVSELKQVRETADPDVAERLLPVFSALADIATRRSGTTGEQSSPLR